MLDIKAIQALVRAGKLETTLHAEEERGEEDITFSQIKECIQNGEILEPYPDDPRGPSCLILGYSKSKKAIHVVCGVLPQMVVRIITVYIPKPPKWVDTRTRAKRGE